MFNPVVQVARWALGQMVAPLGILAILLATGCAASSKRESTLPPPPEPVLYEWHGSDMTGPVSIRISLSKQIAEIEVGGRKAGWTTIATGKPGHGTPTGKFRIMEKLVEKHSSHYGRLLDSEGNVFQADADSRKDRPPPGGRFEHAPMPYWMRLTRWGIGMHSGPIPNPGSPASKGCIRLPRAFAPILFSRVSVGTPVTITR